jgi:hypothetical protein
MGQWQYFPPPCCYFTFLQAGNIRGVGKILCFMFRSTRLLWSSGIGQDQFSMGCEFDPILRPLCLFSHSKSPENSVTSGKAQYLEVYIPGPDRGIIFPSPHCWLRRHPVRVAEYLVRSCYSVSAEKSNVVRVKTDQTFSTRAFFNWE